MAIPAREANLAAARRQAEFRRLCDLASGAARTAVHVTGISTPERTLAAAAADLLQIRLHEPGVEPTRSDAEKLLANLWDIARAVDTVILAIGREAQSSFGLDHKDVDDCFKDTLYRALDGNATALLDQVAERLAEEETGVE